MKWGSLTVCMLVQRQRQTLTQVTFGSSYKPEPFILFLFSLKINKQLYKCMLLTVFNIRSFLHVVLLLSWKEERADSLRITYMSQKKHGEQCEGCSSLKRQIPEEGRSGLPNISQFLIFFLNSSLWHFFPFGLLLLAHRTGLFKTEVDSTVKLDKGSKWKKNQKSKPS